jgi:hypothetical protein
MDAAAAVYDACGIAVMVALMICIVASLVTVCQAVPNGEWALLVPKLFKLAGLGEHGRLPQKRLMLHYLLQ